MATCCAASAEGAYPFKGQLDITKGIFEFSLQVEEGQLNLKVDRREDRSYAAVMDVENVRTPFFEITTQLQGVAQVQSDDAQSEKISGRFFSQHTLIDHKGHPEISGVFDVNGGVIRLMDVVSGGFRGSGTFAIDQPHQLEASVEFEGVDIVAVLDWLAGPEKKFAGDGEVSGQITLSGTPEKLGVKANLISQNGSIENVAYDLVSLHAQGIYPWIDLTNSTVTKTNGFSFDLDGKVDLSDKENMASQIQAIKKVPLIKDNVLQSEWILKRTQDDDGEGKTETKFFLKKDKKGGLSGQEDAGLLGVEKKIGF